MDQFLTLIIDSMETVDGNQNSQKFAEKKVEDIKVKQMIKAKKSGFYNIESLRQKARVSLEEQASMKKTTLFKFKLMRIRSKISFSAFEKHMTIAELFLNQI